MSELKIPDRRKFLTLLGTWCALAPVNDAEQEQRHPISARLPEGIGIVSDYNGPLPTPADVLGREQANDPEIKTAKEILAKAPVKVTPYMVARFFDNVGKGRYGEPWRPYVKGWPVRWNPVIVTFFQATHTVPMGDETSWCAAFVNWCFKQAVASTATGSASSGSFRTFGIVTDKPQAGDLVVFKKRHPKTPVEEQQGHVGFFVADQGSEVEVLGGNQIEGHEQSHMICSKPIPKIGAALALDSYRTDRLLH